MGCVRQEESEWVLNFLSATNAGVIWGLMGWEMVEVEDRNCLSLERLGTY